MYDSYYELYHHGILGQKWGVRRWQNSDGSLTEAGKRHYERADNRWARWNSGKITRSAERKSKREIRKEYKDITRDRNAFNKNGKLSSSATTEFNRRIASIMSTKVTDIRSPSGQVVQFVPKRGEIGVFLAMSSPNYDMEKLRNGIYGNGRVAYKKTVLDKMET